MSSVRLRPDLADLPPYKAGQRPAERSDGLTAFKISSNENPYPPLPQVLEAISAAALQSHRYPDPLCTDLVAAIAERFDVPTERVAVGTGSVAVCGQLISATSGPGSEVLYGWRSFEAYPIWARIAHATSVQVPLASDWSLDLDAIADEITDSTSIIFICSPNNPTGPAVRHSDLVRFLDRVPEHIPVVIDEAYVEFARDPEIANGLALHRERDNVAVLRTFSKAYGLAALRVGFVLAPPALADYVRRTATPFGVSTIAQVAAIASLNDEAELLERVEILVDERVRVESALRAQGWNLPESQANFIWLPTDDSVSFAAHSEQYGLTVRPFPEGVRVTVAETEANDRFIDVARAWRSLDAAAG
ncbi:MAG: aminotransferase class I/II-fold pyridoxal phosphate-dependent enzyme [Actinobacteria bacterium]|uniref:Unannotated protein n=1 Tax=freshwater metagenome TaxID=449393 RepID=A0A6J7IIA2_9ZZZZ|nr:aminotransferase class I/II-fold pyridoxal phosphate-dependent enzyme [Actinomycetota bacterium]